MISIANIPAKNTEILILDTDYNSYAILLYKKLKNLTMKLYGTSQILHK